MSNDAADTLLSDIKEIKERVTRVESRVVQLGTMWGRTCAPSSGLIS